MTNLEERSLDARPDTLDFRDKMFIPTLVEVPLRIDLPEYQKLGVPVLDQGVEGACTGFGLATVAHYLLRRRQVDRDDVPVSARMLYEMARRYDEWEGHDYAGSSARGAMKGWHRHGVCAAELWPYQAGEAGRLDEARAQEARRRPLGAYFRVNHRDIVAMHSAIAEVGVLYATGIVHAGWERIGADGLIPLTDKRRGGHAFALVAYDQRGFWLQNSWGESWGYGGFALVTYDDWLRHATDVWVARLGAPVTLNESDSAAVLQSPSGGASGSYAFTDLRPHVVSLGNDGKLRERGTFGTSEAEVAALFREDVPRITEGWAKKRILLYAHGGLVPESSALQRVADYREALLANEIYPVAFVWKSDFWSTLRNVLDEALRQRRPEGVLDATKDFMLDRLDDALEPIARAVLGKSQWDEMKENALAASADGGGAAIAAGHLNALRGKVPELEVHLLGHSAGAVFLAPLLARLAPAGKIKTCTLWAPSATTKLFDQTYLPAIRDETIEDFALVTLRDSAEQDDHCANIYNKSLLYLVSNAFEEATRVPLLRPDGEPLVGMAKFVERHEELRELSEAGRITWVLAPNDEPLGSPRASTARKHGGFDDDPATVRALLTRIVGDSPTEAPLRLRRSKSSLRERRQRMVSDPLATSF